MDDEPFLRSGLVRFSSRMTVEASPLEQRREWRVTGVVFFGLLTLVILYATVMIIRPFLTAIILAGVLVIVTFGIYRRILGRVNGRRNMAALIMLVFITLVIALPLFLLTMLLVQQANTLIAHMQSGEAQALLQRLDIPGRLMWVKRFVPGFDPHSVSPDRLVLPIVRQIPGWVARNGATVVGSVAGVFITFGLVLLASFFFFVEGEAIVAELKILSPLPKKYDDEFASKFKDVVDATFRGQVMTSLAQGAVTGIGMLIAGVPGSLFWGAVTAISSVIPFVGAAVVWIPAVGYLYIDASMGHRSYFGAIFLTFWCLVVVSTIDNIVRPWVMKDKAELPAIPLLFSVIGAMDAFGFVGLVIGPLVLSMLLTIVDIYKRSFPGKAGTVTGELVTGDPS
jgi:predicted PurR-regulated permease PerM